MKPKPDQTPYEFWQEVYDRSSPETSGTPSAVLERFATDRMPGTALDLGCAKGDDAVWLARRGWSVTAVDISPTVLGYARANAERHVVENRIAFEQHDLTRSFPKGRFDLVCAMFLQTPYAFPRRTVLAQAAAALNSGGLLLVVTHGSAAPWSWADDDHVFPTTREEREDLGITGPEWSDDYVGTIDRVARGPSGQTAHVLDNVIAISRR